MACDRVSDEAATRDAYASKKNIVIFQEWNELQQLKDKENLKIFDSFGNLKFWANNCVKELPFLAQQRELGKLSRGYLADN